MRRLLQADLDPGEWEWLLQILRGERIGPQETSSSIVTKYVGPAATMPAPKVRKGKRGPKQ
jgi:hypothetical protein